MLHSLLKLAWRAVTRVDVEDTPGTASSDVLLGCLDFLLDAALDLRGRGCIRVLRARLDRVQSLLLGELAAEAFFEVLGDSLGDGPDVRLVVALGEELAFLREATDLLGDATGGEQVRQAPGRAALPVTVLLPDAELL